MILYFEKKIIIILDYAIKKSFLEKRENKTKSKQDYLKE